MITKQSPKDLIQKNKALKMKKWKEKGNMQIDLSLEL